jgi:hypothetical protein
MWLVELDKAEGQILFPGGKQRHPTPARYVITDDTVPTNKGLARVASFVEGPDR